MILEKTDGPLRIVVRSPFDAHVHFRQGERLKLVAPMTAREFSGAIVMPNTNPIIRPETLFTYRDEVFAATRDLNFTPHFTLFFQTDYTEDMLRNILTYITAIKFYPKGMTTNSDKGIDPEDPAIDPVLKAMEFLGIPLCVHPEKQAYVMRRERLFGEYIMRWAKKYPKLKIIMEHITDRHSIALLREFENVYATITTHHLLFTTDDVCGDKLKPHHYCKPIAKEPEDLEALRHLVFSNDGRRYYGKKVMLGTDSAPHDIHDKECSDGCAGVFNAPFTLQLLAEEFMQYSTEKRLHDFVSGNAAVVYGLDVRPKYITLTRTPSRIPAWYGEGDFKVVPMWAGKEIPWSITDVSTTPPMSVPKGTGEGSTGT